MFQVSEDEDEVEKKPKKDYCTLNTLQEGLVATCKIYKSGKTEIWFGDHCLSVNKGTQVGFLQVSMFIVFVYIFLWTQIEGLGACYFWLLCLFVHKYNF